MTEQSIAHGGALGTQGNFGRYRELALLGQGGMARVVLAALDGPHGVQKLLVIKEMLPELAIDAELVAMFLDEARLASRLDHPNVVQTFELVEESGRYFFVMEYLDGQPLSSVSSRAKRDVPLPILLRVLSRLLAGLHYAHDLTSLDTGTPMAIVHRDVTPQNVFLGYSGVVKLVDFGIAKVAGAGMKTRTGIFKGKLSYAAPEQLENLTLDRRVDVFSVGVMLWEGLAKRRITKGMSEAGIVGQRMNGDPLVTSVAPNAPPALVAICTKAMSTKKEERYATAAEMQADLDRVIETLDLRATDEDIGRYVSENFAEERTKIRKIVQERLAASSGGLLAAGASPLLVSRAPESSPSNISAASSSTAEPQTSSGGKTDMTQSLSHSPSRGRGITVWISAALGLVAAGAVAFAIETARRTPPSSASPAPEASSVGAVTTADLVDVSIAVTPSNASVALDNAPLTPPYKVSRKRDREAHMLVVMLAGYKTAERTISLERDLHLEIALEPADKDTGEKDSARDDDVAEHRSATTRLFF